MGELKGLFLSLKCHKEGKNGVKSIFSHKQKQKGSSQPWRTEYNPSKDQQQCISTTIYEEKKKEQEHSGKLTPKKALFPARLAGLQVLTPEMFTFLQASLPATSSENP